MYVYVVNHTMGTETGKPVFLFLSMGLVDHFLYLVIFFKELYVILYGNASDPSVCYLWIPEITLVTLSGRYIYFNYGPDNFLPMEIFFS